MKPHRGKRMRLLAVLAAAMLELTPGAATAESFPLSADELTDSNALGKSMPRLAEQVLAAYRDDDRVRYLDNVFRLQIVTGRFRDAQASIAELQSLRARQDSSPQASARLVPFQIYVSARIHVERSGRSLAETYGESFRTVFARLDDPTAAFAARQLLVPARTAAADLQRVTPDQTGRTTVVLANALALLHVYAAVAAYREFEGLPPSLVAEDDSRRYLIERGVQVHTPDGATICAIVVRARTHPERLPALLQFTIYADSLVGTRDALLAAAHGYVGVTGFTRGKACSPDTPVPYVYDGADATALIDWIASQPWSDGRVGIYGGSYSGFTAWAAAKHMPRPLRAIMVGAPVAPGIDSPKEGNVFWNFVYPWPLYTLNGRWLDNTTYNDNRRWNELNRKWYTSGRRYRDLDSIDGTPNPGFAAWLAHPTLDAYWRNMIPQDSEYARITIPVLQTAGYFFGGPGGAAYYFQEHYKHNPGANHFLLIGPYDHPQAQRGVVNAMGDTSTSIAGYMLDPVAQIDIVADLRYQWFDYALRGGAKPALLADRVNYELMGANAWRHAPSIKAMATGRLRVQLGSMRTITVDLADRSLPTVQPGPIDTTKGITLSSGVFPAGLDVSGLMSGHLELITNKRDFDFVVSPYELTADGRYLQLPTYTSRASHVASLSSRRLLVPGRREQLDFTSGLRPLGQRLGPGSRLVVVVSVIKNPGQQINYGTGGDVSDESLVDAGEPLHIQWLGGSYIDFPVHR
jgi:predicted acyl esterase